MLLLRGCARTRTANPPPLDTCGRSVDFWPSTARKGYSVILPPDPGGPLPSTSSSPTDATGLDPRRARRVFHVFASLGCELDVAVVQLVSSDVKQKSLVADLKVVGCATSDQVRVGL
jgi:hypothetical protein